MAAKHCLWETVRLREEEDVEVAPSKTQAKRMAVTSSSTTDSSICGEEYI